MAELPTGTVTFLYTDVEGSTRRWEHAPAAMKAAMARHDALLRAAIDGHGGAVFRTMGDAVCAAFPLAPEAVAAAARCCAEVAAELGADTSAVLDEVEGPVAGTGDLDRAVTLFNRVLGYVDGA